MIPGPESRPVEPDIVVAAVVRRNDSVLLALRPRGKRHELKWEFPGGKVRDGESVAEAIRRELREELDIAVTRVGKSVFAAHDEASGFQIHFVFVEIEGTPRPLEHEEVRWVQLSELPALPLAPADMQFVNEGLATGRG